MSLKPGDKLGPYEIVAPLGAGGMGEVYRARDTRLNREVAIKISAEHFTDRFEREARSIAALNHPNICTLYDVGPDGTELFYRNGSKLMAVPIDAKHGFTPGTPHQLWEGNYLATGHYFDAMPGAKQFLFIKELEQTHGAIEINVVLNWFDELKQRMAAQKQ